MTFFLLIATALAAEPPVVVESWSTGGHEDLDLLGSALSAGDFDGDGYDDVVVATPSAWDGVVNVGVVSVFAGSPSGPAALADWTWQSDQVAGGSVSSAGDVNGDGFDDLVVGANYYSNGEIEEGRAFLFLGSAAGLDPEPIWTAESDQAGAEFGYSVSSAGDVNADGFDDVVVGAPRYLGDPATAEGRVYLFLGSASGLAATPDLTIEGDVAEGAWLGFSVSSAGDVNADGFDDVLVGAWQPSTLDAGDGAVLLFEGAANGLSTAPTWTVESDEVDAVLGASVSSAGDVNADGFGDVIVGATPYDFEVNDSGAAFVFLGSAAGLPLGPSWTAAGFGSAVSDAGDVNADGYDDVIVGARLFQGETDEGEATATVWLGMPSGLGTDAAWSGVASMPEDPSNGGAVAAAGDVNGDGFGDVIVGAPQADVPGQPTKNEGQAFLFLGAVHCLGDEDCEAVTVTGGAIVATDDGDIVAERGEQVEIVWDVVNVSTLDAVDVVTTTSMVGEDVSLITAFGTPAGGPDVAAGFADEIVGTVVEVDNDCTTDHDLVLVVTLSSSLGAQTFAFDMSVVCNEPLVVTTEPWVVGSATTSTVTGALPLEDVYFVVSIGGTGNGPCPPPLGGVCLDVLTPFPKIQRVAADGAGMASWTMTVPVSVPVGKDMWIQAVTESGEKSNVEARTTEP